MATRELAAEGDAPVAPGEPAPRGPRFRRWEQAAWLYLAVVIVYHGSFRSVLFTLPELQYWSTIFLAIVLQALPFLVLGVALSATIAVVVPATWLTRAIPKRAAVAVPAAALAGGLLPGCECSAVPVAGRLVSRGVPSAAAFAFLLAAPAINPVVLVSTAVAFPGRPEMVAARFLASLATAVIVGWIWSARASDRWMRRMEEHRHVGRPLATFAEVATADFVQAGGYLVVGAALVASLQTFLPASWLDALGGSGVWAILVMAVMAVILSVCSEADAFVAAAMPQFSLSARLVFLVVGPVVDIKLVALQVGVFGRAVAVRFAPLTFAVAVLVSAVVGWVLL